MQNVEISIPHEKHFDDVDDYIEVLLRSIRRGEYEGDYAIGRCTADLLQRLISMTKKNDTSQHVIDKIKYFGARMYKEKPTLFVIGNIVRRVLHMIREEYINQNSQTTTDTKKKSPSSQLTSSGAEQAKTPAFLKPLDTGLGAKKLEVQKSAANLFGAVTPISTTSQKLTMAPEFDSISSSSSHTKAGITKILEMQDRGQMNFSSPFSMIESEVDQEISELIDELDSHYKSICAYAEEIVHTNEVILTIGVSHTVLFLLTEAARKKRKFDVIVTQQAPNYSGHEMALKLSDSGINTILIPDSAVFAVMSRVNKVVVGASAVMANGGLVGKNGMHMVALAAKKHNVPMVVCSGIHKLTPMYPLDQESFNTNQNPSDVFPYENADFLKHVNVQNPQFDYVPPNLIDLLVTDHGIHYPHYIYRLLNDFYDQNDNDMILRNENDQEESDFQQ